MRSVPCVLSLALVLAASFVSAQNPPRQRQPNQDKPAPESPRTDAENDGFIGPVKSVSTAIKRSGLRWEQPSGPAMVFPVQCQDCSYDPDGTKTVNGQVSDGKFFGQIIALERDGSGRVTGSVVTNATTGETQRQEVIGPFGKTEEYDYLDGKLNWLQTYVYDQYGHMIDALTVDSQGNQISHTQIRITKDGEVTENSVWGKNNELDWQQTADPATGLERLTTYDESGAVKLTWTFKDGKVLSFWEREQPDQKPQFGEIFVEDVGDGNRDSYQCHPDGRCDRSRAHYEYLDPAKKRNPASAEWRDSSGKLLYAAYYEYEVDSAGNWTHRRVSVFPSGEGDRALYEEDSRTITYWQQ
ncbi:MAG: hypothetical protein ABR987_06705 [Terracidiphilus sp.]|jgi:hypothetical protein